MPESQLRELSELLREDSRFARVKTDTREAVLELRRDDITVYICESQGCLSSLAPFQQELSAVAVGLLFIGKPTVASDELAQKIPAAFFSMPCSADEVFHILEGLIDRVQLRVDGATASRSLMRYEYELGELIAIARALTQERDLDPLLDLILEKSRFIAGADAGSIYVVERKQKLDHDRDGEESSCLRFKHTQNDSITLKIPEFSLPVSMESIAGAAVLTKQPINIQDVYELGVDDPYRFDRSFDDKVGYRTCSMFTIPLVSAQSEVIGVIQLINKKTDPALPLKTPEDFEKRVVSFDERSQRLLSTLAAQAGIALENALLYDEIQRIFDGFVLASVEAIEQRDPTTSGHSVRVSKLTCGLARLVNDLSSGPYADTHLSEDQIKELDYASLLHDFGKIGVREEVLVKAKKLYPYDFEILRGRFAYAKIRLEKDCLEQQFRSMQAGAGQRDLLTIQQEYQHQLQQLTEAWDTVVQCNEPTVLHSEELDKVVQLSSLQFINEQEQKVPLLEKHWLESLRVRRGSLNEGEIDEIRSHVTHTYAFLSKIPWGRTLKNVPMIAGAHHEKIDGSGYPRRVDNAAIPVQSKMMTIADIFDALTASDRPYKKAVPIAKALDILGYEVKDKHIDEELTRIFIESRIYETVFATTDR